MKILLFNRNTAVYSTLLSIEEKMRHVPTSINGSDLARMLAATCLVFLNKVENTIDKIKSKLLKHLAVFIAFCVLLTLGFSLAFGDSIMRIVGDSQAFLSFKEVAVLPSKALSKNILLVLFAMFQMFALGRHYNENRWVLKTISNYKYLDKTANNG